MSNAYTAIDLSQLPAPDVVEQLDYEVILAEMVADLQGRDPSFTALVESDPVYKILEVAAYRELLIRQRVNDSARSVMLAYAVGADLENLGALFGVARLLLDEGDPDAVPPVDPVYEADREYRRRIQLALEGFSTAGPEGAYVFHALSADADVLDASATSPTPGDVLVTVLSRSAGGVPGTEVLDAVDAALSSDHVRPLTDRVTVQAASIVNYSISATLFFYAGPDRQVVMAQAQQAVEGYVEEHHRLGVDITLSGIYAALHQPGVQRVELASPEAGIQVDRQGAAYCQGINLVDGGLYE